MARFCSDGERLYFFAQYVLELFTYAYLYLDPHLIIEIYEKLKSKTGKVPFFSLGNWGSFLGTTDGG